MDADRPMQLRNSMISPLPLISLLPRKGGRIFHAGSLIRAWSTPGGRHGGLAEADAAVIGRYAVVGQYVESGVGQSGYRAFQ